MNDTAINHTDEEVPTFEVSDEALETAAGLVREKAGTFTLAFCSSVNTCPEASSSPGGRP